MMLLFQGKTLSKPRWEHYWPSVFKSRQDLQYNAMKCQRRWTKRLHAPVHPMTYLCLLLDSGTVCLWVFPVKTQKDLTQWRLGFESMDRSLSNVLISALLCCCKSSDRRRNHRIYRRWILSVDVPSLPMCARGSKTAERWTEQTLLHYLHEGAVYS